MQRYVTRSWFRMRRLALSVCLGFLLCSCGQPRVDTGITGQGMQCPDGPHHALNCQALFDQYKRDFSAGLKVFQSVGAQVNVPVHTLHGRKAKLAWDSVFLTTISRGKRADTAVPLGPRVVAK